MSKPTGFLEFQRKVSAKRDPKVRIKDWEEFVMLQSEDSLKEQAARCMNCGTPFCHTGIMLSGTSSGCPVHNKIPDFNDLVYKNRWQEALEVLLETNNFPEFTGRICPAPCEGSCVLGINQPPVAIKDIEYAIIEKGFEMGWIKPEPPSGRTGKKIAIIGSGPAGLAAADQLNRKGHHVKVFEKSDRIGGLLMYGIPTMKLDKKIVDRRIKLLEEEGIEFQTNTEVGVNYPATLIFKEFDAVILCCGAGKPKELQIEGRELGGIYYALDYLTISIRNILDPNVKISPDLNAKGKNVVIIGGGDTGTDCLGTALRQGCRNVVQLQYRPQPPGTRTLENPWPESPIEYFLDYGQQEAEAVFGKDPRRYRRMSIKFEGDNEGRVKAVHTHELKWEQNDDGIWVNRKVEGTEKDIPADLVLLAMGYQGPDDRVVDAFNLDQNNRSDQSDQDKLKMYTTGKEGVFTAGDMRRGQSLVVWAIREGREAAETCHNYLTESS